MSSWRRYGGTEAVPQKPVAAAAISLGCPDVGQNRRSTIANFQGKISARHLACKNGECKRREAPI
jgi:hypothetical protein